MPLLSGLTSLQIDPRCGTSQPTCRASHYYNLKWPFNLVAAHNSYKPSK
jgi:hypothetical protein